MNIKDGQVCSIAKNAFGKYAYTTGVHFSTEL
jgi:hypothetical protein